MNDLTINQFQAEPLISRRSCQSSSIEGLADIYQDDINISIWQRKLKPEVLKAAEYVLSLNYGFRFSASVTPEDTFEGLCKAMGAGKEAQALAEDAAEIVAMFCCLFELKNVGLRLSTLDRAMCPKFHVDRVPCRLVTTYSGIATEWLSHQVVRREKLGVGSQGKPDEESGLYNDHSDIQQLTSGDVALLKGESWLGNEGGGLVHRSPSLHNSKKRLLLTLDFN